jgi:hypothetical protein
LRTDLRVVRDSQTRRGAENGQTSLRVREVAGRIEAQLAVD